MPHRYNWWDDNSAEESSKNDDWLQALKFKRASKNIEFILRKWNNDVDKDVDGDDDDDDVDDDDDDSLVMANVTMRRWQYNALHSVKKVEH